MWNCFKWICYHIPKMVKNRPSGMWFREYWFLKLWTFGVGKGQMLLFSFKTGNNVYTSTLITCRQIREWGKASKIRLDQVLSFKTMRNYKLWKEYTYVSKYWKSSSVFAEKRKIHSMSLLKTFYSSCIAQELWTLDDHTYMTTFSRFSIIHI